MCFFKDNSGLSRFPLGVSCTQWQVKHQSCSRTCRVQKNHNILRKNKIFNEPLKLGSYSSTLPCSFRSTWFLLFFGIYDIDGIINQKRVFIRRRLSFASLSTQIFTHLLICMFMNHALYVRYVYYNCTAVQLCNCKYL